LEFFDLAQRLKDGWETLFSCPKQYVYSRNQLLSSLADADFRVIAPHLEAVDLPARFKLQTPSQPIAWVYFPSSGVASVVAAATRGRRVEVGLIGSDGMTGLGVLLFVPRAAHEIFVQVPGHGHRMDAGELRRIIEGTPSIHRALLRYVDDFMTQSANTALANAKGVLNERLARWLLMVDDRADAREFHLTHDSLALMVGVRRAGISNAMHEFADQGLIETSRIVIRISDRTGLEARANGFYAPPRAKK
jgi:CRP-like cAMP-binding protein